MFEGNDGFMHGGFEEQLQEPLEDRGVDQTYGVDGVGIIGGYPDSSLLNNMRPIEEYERPLPADIDAEDHMGQVYGIYSHSSFALPSMERAEAAQGSVMIAPGMGGDIAMTLGDDRRRVLVAHGVTDGAKAVAVSVLLPDGTRKAYVHNLGVQGPAGAGVLDAEGAAGQYGAVGITPEATEKQAVILVPGFMARGASSYYECQPEDTADVERTAAALRSVLGDDVAVQVRAYENAKNSSKEYEINESYASGGSMFAEELPVFTRGWGRGTLKVELKPEGATMYADSLVVQFTPQEEQ